MFWILNLINSNWERLGDYVLFFDHLTFLLDAPINLSVEFSFFPKFVEEHVIISAL